MKFSGSENGEDSRCATSTLVIPIGSSSTLVLDDQAVDLGLDVVASVLALGALGTGLGYLLNYRRIHDEGATAASTVTYLLPIVAVILGAIVLVGVAASDRRFARPPAPTAT